MPYTNDGEVNSWGWEASLKWQDKIGKNFRYWAGAVSYTHLWPLGTASIAPKKGKISHENTP